MIGKKMRQCCENLVKMYTIILKIFLKRWLNLRCESVELSLHELDLKIVFFVDENNEGK